MGYKSYSFDHKEIEAKWQDVWEEEGIYSPDIASSRNPFYNLWMFPYPSAEGLHAGHAFASTGSDIVGRFQRMNGKDVFQPIGYDSFGIHAENYAIKVGETPQVMLERTTKNYEQQFKSMGHGYDWTHTVTTSDISYYKWTQWLFLKMYKAGLAYKDKADVNFCPSCKTVLADEQVMTPKQAGKTAVDISGKEVDDQENSKVCERCGTLVEKKKLDQWFFKITDYADRLLDGLDKISWSERVTTAQRNWIGKSEGMIITFKKDGRDLKVFTTRPDTLNAVTFLAVSDKDLYDNKLKEKKGEETGEYAVNPLNGKKVPIWKTNYVAPDYATGIVMGVPAHDERDREFAKKYGIDIEEVKPDKTIVDKGTKEGWAEAYTNYHLRDWLVSRQRYWGAPIPMIDCPKCGWQAVLEEDLPVALPEIKNYKPEGKGKGPLASYPEFYKTKCPKCGGDATRETDVMDTFVDSSWYFLRYPSTEVSDKPFEKEITKKWLPVSLYFGGAEHSVLHLMYARFVTMVLKDAGIIDFEEPFPHFFAHGLMIKDGAKMSKSRGNVVNPDEYIKKYGADSLRLYLLFMGPMDGNPDFRDTGIEGMQRFAKRVWRLLNKKNSSKEDNNVYNKMHQTIKKVTEDIQVYKYNTAISAIMELVNVCEEKDFVNEEVKKTVTLLLAPFAPHIMEEVWRVLLGNSKSVHISSWPTWDEKALSKENISIAVQVNGKLRSQITISNDIVADNKAVLELAKKDEKVDKWLKGGKVKGEFYVPGKVVNFVI